MGIVFAVGLRIPVQFRELKMPVAGIAAPTSTYRNRSNLQLMNKYYNEGDTQDKATVVVVACRGGEHGS